MRVSKNRTQIGSCDIVQLDVWFCGCCSATAPLARALSAFGPYSWDCGFPPLSPNWPIFYKGIHFFLFFFKFIQDTKYFWPLIPVCVQQKVHFHDDICSVGHGLSSHRFDVKPHSCVTGTNHTQTAKKPFGVIKRKHTVTQCETCFGPNYQNYQRVGFRFQLLN